MRNTIDSKVKSSLFVLFEGADRTSPKGMDKTKCIKCGRCIVACPAKARRFYGIKYSLAAARFNSAFAARRENEMWFAERNN